MWILECDGDLFRGKKRWLKPGSTYLFGRTKPPDASVTAKDLLDSYVIEDKTVSRKHLIISISEVEGGSATELDARAKILLTDQSKIGTTLDGQKFKDASVELAKHEHVVQLGNYQQKLRIKWLPVVLTPASLRKNSDEVLRERVERFDIKISLDYDTTQTTHVIAAKRNLPRCLQALVAAKHLVTEGFVDALAQAASTSALEEDFENNFPDTAKFVPPAGKEPNPRPDSFIAPNPGRMDVFSGYTFIFCDQAQFETLRDIVNGGSGKAQLYEFQEAQTTVNDFVTYAKGLGGKLVVVRAPRGKDGDDAWKVNIGRDIELALDQRSIEQNEFLDAILMNDAKPLKTPLQEEIVIDSSAPPRPELSASTRLQRSIQESQVPQRERQTTSAASALVGTSADAATKPESPAARRKTYRAPYKSRFAGFDDFDPSRLPKANADADDIDESMPVNDPPIQESVAASGASQIVSQRARPNQPATSNSRKRPASPDPIDEEAFLDEIVPAATELKRRKLEQQRRTGAGAEVGPVANAPPPKPKSELAKATEKVQKVRKKLEEKGELDILGIARNRRVKQEEEADRKEEQLQEAMAGMAGMTVSQMKECAVIEEMDVLPQRERDSVVGAKAGEQSERWDERWNGRKNFKRFRKIRKGDNQDDPLPRPSTVIVGLEVAKTNDNGTGDEYWLEPNNTSRESRSPDLFFNTTQRTTQRTSQNVTQRGNTGRSQASGEQGRKRGSAGKSRVVQEEDDEEPVDDDLTFASKRKAAGPPQGAEKQATKRRTIGKSRRDDDDDGDGSGDDLKFRFRKKK
ncbi:hypothetical protein NA57DRAFT_52004 [Rhizodiscina lignyota]|uniref:FHA domain-containing protein n=1 Tax=Rhizodiscina lignyota TaxID=1504668 RepID=A0A9P4IIY7_9PEZI|nr:hypothetical protein NA57DRAFT_52004 [Rhizodiscina lignyota]